MPPASCSFPSLTCFICTVPVLLSTAGMSCTQLFKFKLLKMNSNKNAVVLLLALATLQELNSCLCEWLPYKA